MNKINLKIEYLCFNFKSSVDENESINQRFEFTGILFDWNSNQISFRIDDQTEIAGFVPLMNYQYINSPLIMELQNEIVDMAMGIISKSILPMFR
jgi:hypothetical protein